MADKKKAVRKKRTKRFTKLMQIKLLGIFALVLLLLLGLNLKIAYITAKKGEGYTKQVLSQRDYGSRVIPYKRGEIRDRNGNVFAKSEKVYNLILDCKVVNFDKNEAENKMGANKPPQRDYIEPTVDAIVQTLGVSESEIREALKENADSQYYILKEQVTLEEKKAFEEYTEVDAEKEKKKEADGGYSEAELQRRQNVNGVWFEDSYVRTYLMPTVASNVIGFSNDRKEVNILNEGICGLEAYYNDVLNGTNGREFGYLDENSDLQRTIIEAQNGNTLVSTLDVNIQQIVEKYIAEFDAQYSAGSEDGRGAKNVGVIVSNPQNGEVLAMASNHGFDLSDPNDVSEWYTKEAYEKLSLTERTKVLNDKWYNFCISESFEPGSTFKPVTISSALECGAITEQEGYYCDGGEFVTDKQINCDNIYGHGQETLNDVMKNSCNDGLMQIGMKMGITAFLKYQKLFNFGSPTGIDLPNESSGILYNRETMHEVELATNTFGQTFTCTMIQEMAAFCATVNGGYYYQPHLVKQILDDDGGVVKNMEPVLLRQPVSEKSSQIVLEAMEQTVQEGTGMKARVPGYRVAGKTGTAEKIDPETGRRAEGKYLVSFIGCAPADCPQVVVYVVIDEPNVADQSTGGYSMIISRKIMMEILPYLNINMTEEITDELLMELEMTRDDVQGGRNAGLIKEKKQEESEAIENGTLETDAEGNIIQTESGGESESSGESEESEQSAAPNPNVPAPLENNGENMEAGGQDAVTSEELGIGVYDLQP